MSFGPVVKLAGHAALRTQCRKAWGFKSLQGYQVMLKKWLCKILGHTKLHRTVDELGIPYPGYCERCRCFVRDEVYEEANRRFMEELKSRMSTEEGKQFTEECERYGF